tara:strand:+ start:131 stop:535 length:405 start_codon:yes stop_codon:yes gene_type:complete
MGSQIEEIVLLVLSLAVCSAFLGLVFQVLRGMFDGYMDKWQDKYLTNDNPVDENDWANDPDVLEFLDRADEQGPYSEEDDKIYTVGGLTADKDQGFKKYIIKRDKPHLQYSIDRFDEKDIEGSNSDNNGDEENK